MWAACWDDVGVLDDGLVGRFGGLVGGLEQRLAIGAAVQAHVDVSVAGDFKGGDAGDGAQARGDLAADSSGRLAQLAREMEGHGQSEVAEARSFGCSTAMAASMPYRSRTWADTLSRRSVSSRWNTGRRRV